MKVSKSAMMNKALTDPELRDALKKNEAQIKEAAKEAVKLIIEKLDTNLEILFCAHRVRESILELHLERCFGKDVEITE